MTLDKEKLFATQRETLKAQTDSIDANFLPEYSQRIPIPPEQGTGFFDFHYFEDVLLGRADCTFKQDTHFSNNVPHYTYGIQIILSGELSLTLSGTKQSLSPKAPEIWLNKGDLGTTDAAVAANQRIRNILIEFSPDFIERIGQEAPTDSLCRQLIYADSPSFIRLPTPSAETIKQMWALYDYAGATNHLELLAIQGATFSLLSHLLNTSAKTKKIISHARTGAERAKAVLDTCYAKPWATRKLARQVGINECDLKREFKALTGMTINHYQRSRRMCIALNLLENGENNLSKIADAVGYQSKDYFVRVFRNYYGFHPKHIF